MIRNQRRLIVALVTDAVSPYHRGGKEQRTAQIARQLSAWADVHVYTMKWWPESTDVLVNDHGVELRAIAPRRELYVAERRSISQALIFALFCFRLLWRRFDRLEVDSIPVFPLFTAKIVCLLRRQTLFSTWHEVWGDAYWRNYLGPFKGQLAGWLERVAILLPDHIVAASPYTADRLRPLMRSGQRLSVSRSGVDLELIDAAEPSGQETDLCVVGRLLDHKRIDLLIEAVTLLRSEGRACRTAVIGTGPESQRLMDLAAKRGVSDLVDFRHDVAEATALYGILKSSKVFVFPSEREGFGIAVLEAMACGLPIVTTTAPNNAAQFLVADSGFGEVVAPTAEAIAAAVLNRLDGFGQPAPSEHWLDKYGWQRVAAEFAEVLECA